MENVSSPENFFTSSTPLDHPKVEENSRSVQISTFVKKMTNEQIEDFFDIFNTIIWIKANNYSRIALQFPDEFLPSANNISKILEERSEAKTFVLADTSYKSCCIDVVAAAHASCDALVHYGEACLSIPPKDIGVRYVLGSMPIDISHLKTELSSRKTSFIGENIVLVTDSMYSYAEDQLENELKLIFNNKNIELAKVLKIDENLTEESKKNYYLGRNIPSTLKTNQAVDLIFIGSKSSPFLPLFLLSYTNCVHICHYDPENKEISQESTRSTQLLRKRLFLIEKLKDANTVGLVVGSVGVDQHLKAVRRMRELCKANGKKIYVISVGKINVPKLANFSSDIDIFVLLSCPFGVLLDSSEFYRPILSFFEAEIAFNNTHQWAVDGGWSADFVDFLDVQIEVEKEKDEGDFSLISGKIRRKNEEKEKEEEEEDEAGKTKSIAVYTAGDYFEKRSWKGLDDGIRIDENTEMQEGRSGIAQEYQGE